MSRKGKKGTRKYLATHCAMCGKAIAPKASDAIIGVTGFAVCRGCIVASQKLSKLHREEEQERSLHTPSPLLSPQEIMAELNKTIIGQPEAKAAIAAAFWKQQLKARGDLSVPRSTLLLYGPTGCGKTAIAREAARIAGLPFISFDATSLSEAGYRGRDAEDMVKDLIQRYKDHKQLSYGVVFLDEVDKLAARGSEHRAAYARGTQHSLLKLVEGLEVSSENRTIQTEDLLFIFGGAFSGMHTKAEQCVVRPIGFCAEREADPAQKKSQRKAAACAQDFISYGMEPELMGRITQRVALDALRREELRRILLKAENSVWKQYCSFFARRGIELQISPRRVEEILDEAEATGSGARGLQTAVENMMQPILFRLAQREQNRSEVWELGGSAWEIPEHTSVKWTSIWLGCGRGVWGRILL